jgi:aldehyde dehydrogenase (NAD+)
MQVPHGIFADGQWLEAQGGVIDIVNPATEEIAFRSVAGSAADVARAVAAARRAFDDGPWPRMSIQERMDVIDQAMKPVADRSAEIAETQTVQMGVPITASRGMVGAAAGLVRGYLAGALAMTWEYVRRDAAGQSVVRREPIGVAGVIAPWNGPLLNVVNKAVPALLAGCTVVVKPAGQTPAEAGLFAEFCLAAGLPPGVLNVVPGGRDTGRYLVQHPDVDVISFTGSTAAGREVSRVCAETFRRVSLELGGKSAGIVLLDADIAEAAPLLADGNFANSGQACIALTRVLVPEGRRDEIVDALCERAAARVLGDPMDPATDMGPLVTDVQRDRVERYIALGQQEGARLAFGGGRPRGLDRGWFVEPTILVGVDNSATIAREEIFGPVMAVITYDGEEQAVSLANDSPYGLHGAVFSADPRHAFEVAKRIRSGSVAVNHFGLTPSTPFGGVKGSGVGREHGPEGIEGFVEYKSYVVPPGLAGQLEA